MQPYSRHGFAKMVVHTLRKVEILSLFAYVATTLQNSGIQVSLFSTTLTYSVEKPSIQGRLCVFSHQFSVLATMVLGSSTNALNTAAR